MAGAGEDFGAAPNNAGAILRNNVIYGVSDEARISVGAVIRLHNRDISENAIFSAGVDLGVGSAIYMKFGGSFWWNTSATRNQGFAEIIPTLIIKNAKLIVSSDIPFAKDDIPSRRVIQAIGPEFECRCFIRINKFPPETDPIS